jgi:hypothetical protein
MAFACSHGTSKRMSPITHFFMGWVVANTVPTLSKRDRAFVTWASVVPDIDGLGIIAEKLTQNSRHPLFWCSNYHHVLGHNLCFALLVSTIAAIFANQKIKATLLVFLSFHLHLLADLVGARGPDGDQWPMTYLLPFSNRLFTIGNVLDQSGCGLCQDITEPYPGQTGLNTTIGFGGNLASSIFLNAPLSASDISSKCFGFLAAAGCHFGWARICWVVRPAYFLTNPSTCGL